MKIYFMKDFESFISDQDKEDKYLMMADIFRDFLGSINYGLEL